MKNLLIKLIALVLTLVACLSMVACGDTHKHAFDQKTVGDDYFASAATCSAPAKYYYSCSCGEKSDETFEVGTAGHDYIDHICKFCQKEEVYTKGLRYVIGKNGNCTITGFEDGATVPLQVIIPQKLENAPVKVIAMDAFAGSTFKNITLPEGLETIMNRAFKDSQLAVANIPSTVKTIYPEAFATKTLEQLVFAVTTNWCANKSPTTNPDPETFVPASKVANPETVADMIKDLDERRGNAYGNWYWFQMSK